MSNKTKSVIGEPKIEYRAEQPYAGIRTQVPMTKLSKAIPQLTDEVIAWLEQHGVEGSGPSIVRYHAIDMEGLLDIEIGMLVAAPIDGDERVQASVLPAGRYAALVYTGVRNGIKGNGALIDWGAGQGLTWDNWQDERGDAFGSRYESLLTNPDDEPNMAKWETEVAIRLADA